MRRVALAFLVIGCASASPVTREPTPRPTRARLAELEERPIWTEPTAPEQLTLVLGLAREITAAEPEPPPSRRLADVSRWAETTFARWLGETRSRIDLLDSELRALLDGSPASLATVAILRARVYDRFQQQIREAPVPEEVAADEELRAIYVEALESASVPLARTAAETYEACADSVSGPLLAWRSLCVRRGEELRAQLDSAPSARPVVTQPPR